MRRRRDGPWRRISIGSARRPAQALHLFGAAPPGPWSSKGVGGFRRAAPRPQRQRRAVQARRLSRTASGADPSPQPPPTAGTVRTWRARVRHQRRLRHARPRVFQPSRIAMAGPRLPPDRHLAPALHGFHDRPTGRRAATDWSTVSSSVCGRRRGRRRRGDDGPSRSTAPWVAGGGCSGVSRTIHQRPPLLQRHVGRVSSKTVTRAISLGAHTEQGRHVIGRLERGQAIAAPVPWTDRRARRGRSNSISARSETDGARSPGGFPSSSRQASAHQVKDARREMLISCGFSILPWGFPNACDSAFSGTARKHM